MIKVKIAIIGGGASGLFCGALLNTINAEIHLFEKNNKLGKKILASGNGKCNFTNLNDYKDKYSNEFAENIINKFSPNMTINEFEKMGLVYKSDDQGRCYPVSENASSVLDCLKGKLSNIRIRLESAIDKIEIVDNKWKVYFNNDVEVFDYVICSSGSLASNLGSEKAYDYLKKLDINISELNSSLTPVIVKENVKMLSGVRVKCNVKLLNNKNDLVYEENGELLFKDNGVSGIAVFNCTHYINRKKDDKYKLIVDVSNGLSEEYLISYFKRKDENSLFKGFLNDKIGDYIKNNIEIKKNMNEDVILRLVKKIKNLEFNVVSLYPLKEGQVCSGGVLVDQVDENLRLIKYPSIYIAGELLDVDGLCGGYNLQFAWSCGGVIANDIKRRIFK